MEQTVEKQHAKPLDPMLRTANALEAAALAVVLLAALALSVTSLVSTNYIDPAHYTAQHVVSRTDSLWFNLAITLAAIALLRTLRRVGVSDRFVKVAAIVILSLLAAAGIVWTLMAKAYPTSDQGILYESARMIVDQDFSELRNAESYLHFYFVRFPFQFGFLSYLELLIRAFGEKATLVAAPILNVLMLISGYAALLLTTRRLFHDNRVTLLTLLFLSAGVQPVLSCTLIYGLIPALSLSLWAAWFTVRFVQSGRKREIAGIALFCAAAVYMKPNAWIFVVSIAIVLGLTALRKRRWSPLIAAAVAVVVCVPLPKIAQNAYEARIGTSAGAGYPMSSWMAMGMREGAMACGWYNSYSQEMYRTYGTDIETIKRRNAEDIRDGLAAFAEDPAYAYWFFQDKFSSQWNEPTFESVWVSGVCESYGERSELAENMYDGEWPGTVYDKAMNYMVQLIYAGFLLSVLALFKKRDPGQLLYPIAILGGILFHLLFEANSKYVISYLPLFYPLAAYGVLSFKLNIGRLTRLVKRRRNRKKNAAGTAV